MGDLDPASYVPQGVKDYGNRVLNGGSLEKRAAETSAYVASNPGFLDKNFGKAGYQLSRAGHDPVWAAGRSAEYLYDKGESAVRTVAETGNNITNSFGKGVMNAVDTISGWFR
jgi:hypothetical protein